ncbi:MAG: HlyD family secretion protein [Anaerolineaceae bacterium]|nr:HlyD family secretion protein [Anaerolineaceae bacterium]
MTSKGKKNKKRNLILWLGIIILIVAGVGGYLYYRLIFIPSQNVSTESSLQTATIRQGDLILRVSGAATLVAADERTFGFDTNGKLASLSVSVGDQVEAGQLLAQLDNSKQAITLQQAERNLAELTSPLALAKAKQSVSDLNDSVDKAHDQLAYYISPNVLYWEDFRDDANAVLTAAKAMNDSVAIEAAETNINRANTNLVNSWSVYESEYVPETFVVVTYEGRESIETIVEPSEETIQDARDTLYYERQKLVEAQYLVTALEEGSIPEGSFGSGITQLINAQIALDSAQDDLDATSLYAPIDGKVTAINSRVGETIGTNFMTIVNFNNPQVEIFLDSSDWASVSVGYSVEVVFDALPDTIFTGKVIQVDPLLVQSGGSLIVNGLAELDEESLTKIGLLPLSSEGAVDVISGRADAAILAPVESLRDMGNGKYAVFVMKNGTPTLQVIEVGLIDVYYAEVISGLKVGDIVTTGIMETN